MKKNILLIILCSFFYIILAQNVWNEPLKVFENKDYRVQKMYVSNNQINILYIGSDQNHLSDLFLKKTDISGNPLTSEPQTLVENNNQIIWGDIVEQNTNQFFILWVEVNMNETYSLYANLVNSDGVSTWGEPVLIRSNNTSSINQVKFSLSPNGSCFVSWVEPNYNQFSLYYNYINSIGVIINQTPIEVDSGTFIFSHKTLDINNEACLLYSKFNNDLQKELKLLKNDCDSLFLVYSQAVPSENFENETADMLVFNNKIYVSYSNDYSEQNQTCKIACYSDHKLWDSIDFDKRALSLIPVNETDLLFLTYQDNNLNTYRLNQNGESIQTNSCYFSYMLNSSSYCKLIINKACIENNNLFLSLNLYSYAITRVLFMQHSFFTKINLTNLVSETLQIEDLYPSDYVHSFESVFHNQKLLTMNLKADFQGYNYLYKGYNLSDMSFSETYADTEWAYNNNSFYYFFTSTLFNKDYFMLSHIDRSDKFLDEFGNKTIFQNNSDFDAINFKSIQISDNSFLKVIYNEYEPYDIPIVEYSLNYAILNNNHEVLDSFGIGPIETDLMMPAICKNDDFTWMAEYRGDHTRLIRIENDHFDWIHAQTVSNFNMYPLQIIPHYLLCQKITGEGLLFKYLDDCSPDPEWPEQGLSLGNLNLFNTNNNVSMFLTDNSLLIVWEKLVSDSYCVNYAQMINTETGQVLWSSPYNLGNGIYSKFYKNENQLLVVCKNPITNKPTVKSFSFSYTGMTPEWTRQLLNVTVQELTSERFENRILITMLIGNNIVLKTLSFNNTSDQFTNGFSLTLNSKEKRHIQLNKRDDQHAFINWMEKTPNSFYYTIYTQYVNLDDFTSNQDPIISPTSQLFYSNYPNPFNPETKICFFLPVSEKVSLDIYNIKGQKVKTLIREKLEKGSHEFVWKGDNDTGQRVTSGIYFYKLSAGDQKIVRKMMLLK